MMTSWDETWKKSVVPSGVSDGKMMVLSSKYRVNHGKDSGRMGCQWGFTVIGFDAGFIVIV
jgi:hypothetical protein